MFFFIKYIYIYIRRFEQIIVITKLHTFCLIFAPLKLIARLFSAYATNFHILLCYVFDLNFSQVS